MAKGTYWQRGEAIDYRNVGDADIEYNDIVKLADRIGIAGCDIPVGAFGSLHVLGVFELPADKEAAFAAGQVVYWDGEKIVSTAENNTKAGWAIEPKAAGIAFVKIKIG